MGENLIQIFREHLDFTNDSTKNCRRTHNKIIDFDELMQYRQIRKEIIEAEFNEIVEIFFSYNHV